MFAYIVGVAIAHDPLPVYETAEPFRYEYLPPMSTALEAAPHLWINPGSGGSSSSADKIYLGTITRDYEGEPLAAYQVFLVK